MSPVTLQLTNFGPFRDEMIDFTKFSATPLFLISGKTGSGKTTIFDGMCYALFNQTSGGDREAKAMRSDFATPDDPTRVTFTFTHRQRRYEIVREPTQILAKKRGTGLTESAASVTLTIFENGSEQDQITKEGKVRDYLQELLQMDGKQFAQIVLLPQGQFRRFLVAPSEDKAAVLEQLFNTTIFARWTAKLKAQLKRNEAGNRETAAALTRLQAELKWLPDFADRAATLRDNQQTAALIALMATQQQATHEQIQQVTSALKQADQDHSALVRQDEQEAMLVADRQQLVQRQAEQQELLAQELAMTELKATIAELEWAQQIQPQWLERERTRGVSQQRKAEITAATTALTAAEQQQKAALTEQQENQKLATQIEQASTRLAQQQALAPIYQQVAQRQQQQRQVQETLDTAKEALQACQQELAANAQAQIQPQQVVKQQDELFATQNQLTQRQAKLTATAKQVDALTQLSQKLATAEAEAQQAQNQVMATQQEATQQRQLADTQYQAFLRSQIATLSAQLTEGSPCPVCGAEHHPQPASVTTITVTEAEVKAAQATAGRAEKLASEAAAKLTNLQQRVIDLQTTVAADLKALQQALDQPSSQTLSQLQATQQEAMTAYEQDEAKNRVALQALQVAQTALKQLSEEAQELQRKADQLTLRVTANQSQLDKLTAALATDVARLPVDATTFTEFTKHLTELKAELTTDQQRWEAIQQAVQQAKSHVAVCQSQVTQAQQEFSKSQTAWTQAKQAVTDQLVAHFGIDSSETVAKVAATMAALPTLPEKRETLADFQKHQDSLVATIQELSKRTQGKAAPKREQTQQALAAAKAAVITLQEQQRQSQNLWDFNDEQSHQLQQLVAKQAAAMQTTQEITELSGVVNGDGPNSKLGLERYVLQTYLRQILKVGNHRLKQLTNGRYQFVIDASQANSKKRSGLEINVYDDHVGEQRSVHTLSGGESFIASLALALALGEVIQQTTGSVDVDALFIDEGFGSLDEDALMTALESLETIEGQHRMIGIISHVSELRDQVENQLQVVANGNGESTIRYHAAE